MQIHNLDAADVSTGFPLIEARLPINPVYLVFLPIIEDFIRFVRWVDK